MVKSLQKSNWPLTIHGKKHVRIIKHKEVLGPNHLRLGTDVRKAGFFCSSVS